MECEYKVNINSIEYSNNCNNRALNERKEKNINNIRAKQNNKNNIIIILLTIINLLFSTNQSYNLNSSRISLKIMGIGLKNIFCSYNNDQGFKSDYYPNAVYINQDKQNEVNYSYYFNMTENFVELIWNNTINNCKCMFCGCTNISEIDLTNFNSSLVIDMKNMFKDCSLLASINLSNFNTSKVKSMDGLFSGCSFLTSLNLASFNTSLVTNMGSMF